MVRKLASIQKVLGKKPIPNADKIEVVMINGWEVVAKKDEFNVGDFVVYVEIDSKLPERPEFEFMRSRNFKVKTIKLKGQVSQGIVFPLSILENKIRMEWDDVTEELGIINFKDLEEVKDPITAKNTPILDFLYRYPLTRPLAVLLTPKKDKSVFPNFIKKTDEERVQNNSHFLLTLQTRECIVTEKLDGCSATYFIKKKGFLGRKMFGVCSRNLWLKTKHTCNWWDVAEKYNLEQKMKKVGGEFYIQGEIVGPSIQGNKYGLTEKRFYLFNAYDMVKRRYFTWDELILLSWSLNVEIVPFLNNTKYMVDIKDWKEDNFVRELVKHSKGFSSLNCNSIREGFVIRENTGDYKNSIKVINPDFLIKHGE